MEKQVYEYLLEISQKYQNLLLKLEDNNIIKDIWEYKNITKEIAKIKDINSLFQKYLKVEKDYSTTKKMLNNEKNEEILELAKQEILLLENKLVQLEKDLKIAILPKDSNDAKNIIIEIRGAAGGDEANLFVQDVFNMYKNWILNQNMHLQIIDYHKGNSGGFTQLIFKIDGKNVYSKFKFESGVHRVQRIPITETQGRVHTSTVTVIVMPEPDEKIDIKINNEDLKIDTYRSSGAGGQSVNTTDSAVRITHLPTGIVASSQDGKSQIANKDLAMKVLKSRLYDLERQKEEEKKGEYRKLGGSGARSEKIRTYNYPQDRVTDHRINFSTSLKSFMLGKMDDLINALIAKYQLEKMENQK